MGAPAEVRPALKRSGGGSETSFTAENRRDPSTGLRAGSRREAPLIVTCEQCATQFQLADSKIPAGGTRVRCSRCKHAFFIEPAGEAPPQGVVERVVLAALDAEAPPSPEATEDLPEAAGVGGEDFADEYEAADAREVAAERDVADESELADESDWEFSEAPFGDDASPASEPIEAQDAAREAIDDLLGANSVSRPADPEWSAASAFAAPADADEGELGNPESWDLLAGSSSANAALVGAAPAHAAEVANLPAPLAPARSASALSSRPQVDEWIEPTEPSRLLAWVARSGHAAGWIVTAALFALVAFETLGPSLASDSEPSLGTQRLAQLEAQGIAGRWVENVAAGPLFVVSGRLVNPTASPMPLGALTGVRLLDASGARLAGEPAAIGPVLEARELRESDPAALQARQLHGGQNLALTSLQPGQSLAFEAVVVAMPAAASRFVLEPIPPGRGAALANVDAPAPAR